MGTDARNETLPAAETASGQEHRQKQTWFSDSYDEIYYYILEHFSVLDVDSAFYRLAAALPNCKAQTSGQFIRWAKKQIKKQANESRIFDHSDRLSLQDVLTLAAARPTRKGAKPFEYEVHGEKAFVKLEDRAGNVLPWIIPAEWLPVARALWPVHVRFSKSGPYASKKIAKQRLDGTWTQSDLPVHRLFLNCDAGHIVEPCDGNFLNWTDGNLRIRGFEPNAVPQDRTVPLETLEKELSLNWRPAKPKRLVNREQLGANDYKVLAWLRGRM